MSLGSQGSRSRWMLYAANLERAPAHTQVVVAAAELSHNADGRAFTLAQLVQHLGHPLALLGSDFPSGGGSCGSRSKQRCSRRSCWCTPLWPSTYPATWRRRLRWCCSVKAPQVHRQHPPPVTTARPDPVHSGTARRTSDRFSIPTAPLGTATRHRPALRIPITLQFACTAVLGFCGFAGSQSRACGGHGSCVPFPPCGHRPQSGHHSTGFTEAPAQSRNTSTPAPPDAPGRRDCARQRSTSGAGRWLADRSWEP